MEKDTEVIQSQNAIHVFLNVAGGITIQQVNWPDEDDFVNIEFAHVEKLVSALRSAKKEATSKFPCDSTEG